jgi:hypothetical protein
MAVVVRVWGLRFGLPHTQARPDEVVTAWLAWRLFSGNLNPEWFTYPSLLVYLLGGLDYLYYCLGLAMGWFRSLPAFVATWTTHWTPFFLIARAVSAAAGAATVWLVYRLGSRAVDRRVGLVAAAMLALAPLHVRDSHFGVTDVPMTFFVTAAVLLTLRAFDRGAARDFAMAGAAAGLATGTKYGAGLLVVPGLIAAVAAAWLGARADGRRWRAAWVAGSIFVAAMVMGFVVSTPYAVLDSAKFLSDVRLERDHMRFGHGGVELGSGWLYHVTFSLRYGLGLPLLCAGLAGIPLALWLCGPRALIALAFPLAYYAFAGSSSTMFVRYAVPLVPFVCLTGAVLVVWAADRAPRRLPETARGAVASALTIALLIPAAASVVRSDRLLASRDNRLVAGAWLRQQAAPGATIHQSASTYGQLQPEADGPRGYRYWQHRGAWTFAEKRHVVEGLPDWLVLEESPLGVYSTTPPEIRALAEQRYDLVRVFEAVDLGARNVYDQQDAFYVPYAGFERVRRPGPNFKIYLRRSER